MCLRGRVLTHQLLNFSLLDQSFELGTKGGHSGRLFEISLFLGVGADNPLSEGDCALGPLS